MANDRLRDALLTRGITPHQLAEKLGVDPKTTERWITLGRTPYRKHRHRIAAMVQESEAYLWPDASTEDQRASVAESEIVHVCPHRSSVPRDLWRHLFDTTEEAIDILVYSGMFLPDQYPRLAALLRGKADSGVTVRILLRDPGPLQVAHRAAEEGIGDATASKIRNACASASRTT